MELQQDHDRGSISKTDTERRDARSAVLDNVHFTGRGQTGIYHDRHGHRLPWIAGKGREEGSADGRVSKEREI